MVQVSPSPPLDVTPPSVHSEEGEDKQEDPVGSPCGMNALEVNTTYQDYENYIENGLICLKHKVRNLEKKKLKLEDYKRRLTRGDVLNKDQMAAVEKYEEVQHHLAFAREMHKTLDSLTQTLLRAQKKAAKKEQLAKMETEKKRLSNVLQVQHLLHSLQQEHIRSDLLTGHNQAPHVSAQQLQGLNQLSTLLGVQRDHRLSLEAQMEQASLVYIDLLDGKNKPVAGSTYKLLKQEITELLDCKYFSCLPSPPRGAEVLLSSAKHTTSKPKPNDLSKKESWKDDFQAMREQEPPDSWDMEFQDGAASAQTAVHKPWRGAAAFIPKVSGTSKKQSADGKQRKERRTKGEQHTKLAVCMDVPAEMFDSPTALPKDPILRRQHLEDLMTKIHSSFSFVQDSLLDGESSPTKGHSRLKRQTSGSPSPLAQTDLRSQDVLPKAIHPLPLSQSTPLPARPLERKSSLANGDQCLETCDLELSTDLPLVTPEFAERKRFASPLLYRQESTISLDMAMITVAESGKQSPNGVASCTPTPPQGQPFSTPPTRRTLSSSPFQSISPVPQNGELDYKPDFGNPRYTTVSTQTSPVFAHTEDEPQPDGGPIFLSPGQSSGAVSQSSQPYYNRGSVRGMARGGKGVAQVFRSSGWHRGGAYIPQNHFRDSGPPLYAVRDYRRGGGRHNQNATWSDSSQVSSPDREGTYTMVDSGHGDSLTPRSHHHHTNMLPMQLYPLSQRLHVSFSASLTANFAPGNLDQPIVFDHLHCNLGEMYDTHIGRFTSPVNGTYVFNFNILKLAANSPLFINLMCNEEVMASAYANDGAPDHDTASNSAILTLFQGDQVWLRLHRGAVYGSTWNYSTFSGFLLYQD
ncbi:caprin-2 isoform X2 [Halichoeres trimaculatus]|uniref:caprin-2 isoform X2 n=1 Tax=Halichoeres trimaculatus TaxID=147232 RepID=UPI003D9E12E1